MTQPFSTFILISHSWQPFLFVFSLCYCLFTGICVQILFRIQVMQLSAQKTTTTLRHDCYYERKLSDLVDVLTFTSKTLILINFLIPLYRTKSLITQKLHNLWQNGFFYRSQDWISDKNNFFGLKECGFRVVFRLSEAKFGGQNRSF